MSIDLCYQVLSTVTMVVLVVLALLCLVRCVLGPRISDRVMAINMIGTLTIIMVVVFVVALGEGYLADIALVYAMLSFRGGGAVQDLHGHLPGAQAGDGKPGRTGRTAAPGAAGRR